MQELAGAADWPVSAAQLGLYLDITARRVQQLAADNVIASGDGGQYMFLASLRGYVLFLQGIAAGKAMGDESKQKQRVQIEVLEGTRDKAQMAMDVERGKLVTIDAVRDATVRLVKVLTEGADSLPDLLERKTGIPSSVVTAVGEVCDQWRTRLYERAMETLGGAELLAPPAVVHTSARAPEPEADPTPRRPLGRPRKVRTDAFTPNLI